MIRVALNSSTGGLARRIIPCLDVDRGRVVKGVKFIDIRDAGDPVEVARRYNEAVSYTHLTLPTKRIV